MIRKAWLLIAGSIASIATSSAQQPAVVRVRPQLRTWGVSGGWGSGYGGVGGNFDWYFAKSRLSLAVGGGYLPTTDNGGPGSGAAGAAIRAYTKGVRHRALLELSVTLLSLSWRQNGDTFFDVHGHYGPGICGGYQFTAMSGFTVLMTGGVGWEPNQGRLWPIGDLGFGYTWRR